jgi:hypothetical protein
VAERSVAEGGWRVRRAASARGRGGTAVRGVPLGLAAEVGVPFVSARARTGGGGGAPSGGHAWAATNHGHIVGARAAHERTHCNYVMIGMISSATMLATLIIGLIAGPAVSL